jgi:hypothetical protein
MAAWREGEDNPFHTEVGYWLWDGGNRQVMRCFMVPRGSTLIAGGTVDPGSTKFTLEASLGSRDYGVLSNKYLDEFARTTRFEVTISVEGDVFTYDETTTVEIKRTGAVVLHTDRNVLQRVSWES